MIKLEKDTFVSNILSDIQNPQNYEVIEFGELASTTYRVLYSFGQRKVFWISSYYSNIMFYIYQSPILYQFTEDFIILNDDFEEEMVRFVKEQLMNPNCLGWFVENNGVERFYSDYNNKRLDSIWLSRNLKSTERLNELLLRDTKFSNILLVQEENKDFVDSRLRKLKDKTLEVEQKRLTSIKSTSTNLVQLTHLLIKSFFSTYSRIRSYNTFTGKLIDFKDVFSTLNDFFDSVIITKTFQFIYQQFGSFFDGDTIKDYKSKNVLDLFSLVDESLLSKEELIVWMNQKLEYLSKIDINEIKYSEISDLKVILNPFHNKELQLKEMFKIEFSAISFFYFFKTLDEFTSQSVTGSSIHLILFPVTTHQILNYLNLPTLLQLLQKHTHSGLFTEETVTVLEKLQEEIQFRLN